MKRGLVPADLTIFGAKYLVFIAAALAAGVLALQLWPRSPLAVLRWAVAAGVVLVLSYGLARLGGAVYNDPRPFVSGHVHPLIAHAPDNGFPSDHALLAAALVALVALVDVRWSLPFILLTVLVDWARVGAGIHHVIDVLGSDAFVAVATLVALLVTRLVMSWLTPHVPSAWQKEPLLSFRPRG